MSKITLKSIFSSTEKPEVVKEVLRGFTSDVLYSFYENIEKTEGPVDGPKINPAAGLAAITEAYQRARRRLLGQ